MCTLENLLELPELYLFHLLFLPALDSADHLYDLLQLLLALALEERPFFEQALNEYLIGVVRMVAESDVILIIETMEMVELFFGLLVDLAHH